MTIIVYNADGLELERWENINPNDVQAIIDLFKQNDYLDTEGNLLRFEFIQIEPNQEICIYLTVKES